MPIIGVFKIPMGVYFRACSKEMYKRSAHIEYRVQSLIICSILQGNPTPLRIANAYPRRQTAVIDEVFVCAVLSDFIVVVIFEFRDDFHFVNLWVNRQKLEEIHLQHLLYNAVYLPVFFFETANSKTGSNSIPYRIVKGGF